MELVDVIAHMHMESDLPPAPLEGCKIQGFCAGLDVEEQPSSSYRLPIGDASVDILANIGDCISSSTSGMCSKKILLLPYPGVRSRR